MKTIIVVGRDWKFRALLRAQLREEGYEALAYETLNDAAPEVAGAAALVFDTTDANIADCAPALRRQAERLPVIVVAAADEHLDIPGVTLRHRPVSLADIISVVRNLTSAAP